MFRRYGRNCGCQCNNPAIETACKNAGTTAEYVSYNCCNQDDNNTSSCGCGFDEGKNLFPDNPMLAQSYVPMQYLDKTFTPCCGFKMGTIFPELVSPYKPGQSMEEIAYLKARNEIGEGCNR